MGQGGKLNENITQEIIDSSDSVLQSYMGRGTRGLQQFFTPPEAAKLIHTVLGDIAVLDPTAGDGALLKPFSEGLRFGIEIEPVLTKEPDYKAITGDLQKVYPLLRMLEVRFHGIVCNPPFGLIWDDAIYGKHISSRITYQYALNLIDSYSGQGVLICGADKFTTEIQELEDANKFYAAIDVEKLFKDADIKTTIAFFTVNKAENYNNESVFQRWSCSKEELPEQSEIVKKIRQSIYGFKPEQYTPTYEIQELDKTWKIIQKEYDNLNQPVSTQRYSISMNGNKLCVQPTPFQQLTLAKQNRGYEVMSLHNQSIQYFLMNPSQWRRLLELNNSGVLTINPKLITKVENTLEEGLKQLCPLYPVKPQQRLAYLADLEKITCIKSDGDFVAGEEYSVYAETRITHTRIVEPAIDKQTGAAIEVTKEQEAKCLRITINGIDYNESEHDINYITEHFLLPDPGDLLSKYPEATKKMLDVIDDVEKIYGAAMGWKFKPFQREDISRLLLKRGGLLAWEQGLGKTLGAMAFARAAVKLGAKDVALFIIPQDLCDQWQREAMFFFGETLQVIRTAAEAKEVAHYIMNGGVGWYVTYYEAISRNGRAFETLKSVLPKHKQFDSDQIKKKRARLVEDGKIKEQTPTAIGIIEFCPNCNEHASYEWNPKTGLCGKCGYRHRKISAKPAYQFLTKAFKDGVVCIDEGTKIKSNYSLMSLSVRGIKAKYRLLLSGTPVKNFINDCFWLLHWAMGDSSIRFPFSYEGGYAKFAKEFSVTEWKLDAQGRRQNAKTLPKVCNLSILWRLLCSSIVRRRKQDTGEHLVNMKHVPIVCPLGIKQKSMYAKWLLRFDEFFCDKYPDKKISQYPNLVNRMSVLLGSNWKLFYSSLLPEAEQSGYFERGSNWMPSNLKVLQLAKSHAENGDKVVIGSSLVDYGPWIVDQLNSKGVPSKHIVDETADGEYQTKSPKKRADVIKDFQYNGTKVLACTTSSLQLGHNISQANVIILHGLPWDASSLSQFIARVHRLTSKKDVICYIVMTDGTIDCRQWELLNQKQAASDLALDGELFNQETEQINLQQVIDELIEQGFNPKESAIDEKSCERAWQDEPQAVIEKHEEKIPEELSKQLNLFQFFQNALFSTKI